MLEVIAAPGQPLCADPRKKIDYWLLMAECREKTGDYEGATKALREAITWNCTPMARIDDAMNRIEMRKLLAIAASTPVKKYPKEEEDVQSIPQQRPGFIESPLQEGGEEEEEEFGQVANKYASLIETEEKGEMQMSTPKSSRSVIENAAKMIQSAKTSKIENHPRVSTPRKETNSVDRGTKLILTPIRASKRIKTGMQP